MNIQVISSTEVHLSAFIQRLFCEVLFSIIRTKYSSGNFIVIVIVIIVYLEVFEALYHVIYLH